MIKNVTIRFIKRVILFQLLSILNIIEVILGLAP